MAAGLQTSIWNNNIKSMILLAAYPFILCGVVFCTAAAWAYYSHSAVGFQPGQGMVSTWGDAARFSWFITAQYWPIIFTVVLLWFIIAYFFQGSMIRALAKSKPVTRIEEPTLYNLVENLSISQGMTMPRLEIMETDALNAFASGINKDSYCITVTRGLLRTLPKDELEGVLAHELSHIIHRDVRLMMVCAIFTGMLGFTAQMIWSTVRYNLYYGSNRRERNGGGLILILVVMVIVGVGYGATLLMRFAISRKREYMADAGSVQMTKNPEAMIRALMHISGHADIQEAPADIKAMCFENAQAFLGLFATHPPISGRIAAIAEYSGIAMPDLAAAPQEALVPPSDQDDKNPWN